MSGANCAFLLPSKLQKPESIPRLYPSRPQLLLSKVHTCCRPPPVLEHTCSNTQNKQADSTQPSTFCDNFRGMVSLWRGGGKIIIAAESAAFNHLSDAVGLRACGMLLFGYEASSKHAIRLRPICNQASHWAELNLVQIICQILLKDWPVKAFCRFGTWLSCKNSLPMLTA